MTTYKVMQKMSDALTQSAANALDYDVAWMLATLQNHPTTYKGKGRPRKTDYGIWKHPFDGKTRNDINYPPTLPVRER